MKNEFQPIITLSTDAYASEYRSGKMDKVGDNQNIHQIVIW